MDEDFKILQVPRVKSSCILSKGMELSKLQESEESELVETSPCTSEKGELMVEVELSKSPSENFLDFDVLKLLLESYKDHFSEMKFSSRLKTAKLLWKEHRIYIHEDGKFKVRFAHTREDAIQVLKRIGRLIVGSLICNECKEPSVNCVTGKCGSCQADGLTRIPIEELFNGPILVRSLDSLEGGVELLDEVSKNLNRDPSQAINYLKKTDRKLKEAIEYALNFSIETQERKYLTGAVAIIAIARKNILLLEKLRDMLSLSKEEISDEKRKELIGIISEVIESDERLISTLRV